MSQLTKGFEKIPLDLGRSLNIISIIVGLAIWEYGTKSISTLLLAPPTDVLTAWIQLVETGQLQEALYGSIQHMLLGYVLAFVVALPVGFAIAQSEAVRLFLNPYIDAIYSTPVIAYLPLIIVWFGLRFEARVFMVFMFCVFEMLITFQEGVTNVTEEYTDVGRSFDLTWLEQQLWVVLPASLPYIFGGLRLGIGRAVRGMVVAELFLAVVNLGKLLIGSTATFSTRVQLAVIVTISIFGVLMQGIVTFSERRIIPWYHTGDVE